jgi:hypothetical protein
MHTRNKILRSAAHFGLRVFRSRVGQLLFLLHLMLVAYAYWERAPTTKVPIHFFYESTLLKTLIVLDLPALILCGIVAYPLTSSDSPLSTYQWSSWIAAAIVLSLTSIQWWIIGYLLGHILWRKPYVPSDIPH